MARAKKNRVDEAITSIKEVIKSGKLNDYIAPVLIVDPKSAVPCESWSLMNRFMVIISGTADARGYRQWEKAGRQVKKGAKAIYILAPSIITREKENEDTGEKEKKQILIGFHGIPVFRYEDTEGEPLEKKEYVPPELPVLSDVATRWGIAHTYGAVPDTSRRRPSGWYSHSKIEGSTDLKIHLMTHEERVFFHELSHAAHDRLGLLKERNRGEREAVAETSAAVLGKLYGYSSPEMDKSSAAYVLGWLTSGGVGDQKVAVRKFTKLLTDVEKVVHSIISAHKAVTEEKEAAG